MSDDDRDRDEGRAQLPFEGLHVYQRAQEAWTRAPATVGADPLGEAVESELRRAALGIARATALSRTNGAFTAGLEEARGALHAAAALLDQMARRGTPADEAFRTLLVDGARMLGALIRSVAQPRPEASEEEVAA